MKSKLVYRSFSPSLDRAEFYYKPGEKWNNLVFSDMMYTDYYIRVYGEIPSRINPVILSLMEEDGSVLFEDFKVDLAGDTLSGILEKGGDCEIELKDGGMYLCGKKIERCV